MSNGFPTVPGTLSRELTAQYRLTTSAYIGDGTQAADGIRPPSFKGVMRYWWRCLNYGRIKANTTSTDKALAALHHEESELFGVAGGQHQGQSLFTLHIQQPEPLRTEQYAGGGGNTGIGYLAYGIWGNRDQGTRSGIPAQSVFSVTLKLKPGCSKEQENQLNQVLWIMGLLGNLGSRSRNGFGSLALEKLNGKDKAVATLTEYQSQLAALLDTCPRATQGLPGFSAWSESTRIVAFPSFHSADASHSNLGSIYMEFRRGKRGKDKLGLGLPLTKIDTRNRRASPLWFHIHPIGEQFHSICIFMPADFHHAHPQGDKNMLELGEAFLAKAQERLI